MLDTFSQSWVKDYSTENLTITSSRQADTISLQADLQAQRWDHQESSDTEKSQRVCLKKGHDKRTGEKS